MKGEKDEGKVMEPLFPRLHVNDREKGGPRAPPRNKMALYEQFSIPSKRFGSSASSSSSPTVPSQKVATLAPCPPAIQTNGHEKMVLSPSNMPPIPHPNSEERVHDHPSDKTSLNTTRMEFGTSFKRHASNNISIARGLAPECSSHHLPDSNAKKTRENVEDDDFCVPTFVPPEVVAFSNCDFPVTQPEKLSTFHIERSQKSSSIPLSTLRDKCLEGTDADRNTRNYMKGHSEQRSKETSVLSTEIPDSRRRFTEPSSWAKTYLDEDNTGIIDVDKHSRHANQELHQESSGNGHLGGSRCLNHRDVVEEERDSTYITGSCSKARLGNNADKFDQGTHDKPNDPLQLGDGDSSEVSEVSMVGSIACMMISPDDVVGVIGTKHFWKARRAIVNQQRVFGIQVFELHRLIKVQKLIATSSDALKIDLYLRPSPPKVISENLPTECIEKSSSPDNVGNSHQPDIEQNNLSEKLSHHMECQEEIPVRDPPQCEISGSVPHSTDPAPEIRPNAFCFQPPTNQWLVPVMSPSEGLIYKPYSGPCPPLGGFMPPFYGGYAPHGFQPMGGGFMNSAYGPLPCQQPPSYFTSPYGLPMVNPMFMASATEQTNPFAGLQHNEHDLQQSRSSRVMSNPRKETISGRVRKFQASKDSEVQGSTVSSPCEQARDGGKEALLFHTPQTSGTRNQMAESCRQNHAIRVVPHNARSATESAARIFRSIQRERGSSTRHEYQNL